MCSIPRSTISARIDRTSPANGGAWSHSSRLWGIRNSPRYEVAHPASRSLRGRYFQSSLPGGSVARGGCVCRIHSLVFGRSIVRIAGELAVYTYKCIIRSGIDIALAPGYAKLLQRAVIIFTDEQRELLCHETQLWLLFIFYPKPIVRVVEIGIIPTLQGWWRTMHRTHFSFRSLITVCCVIYSLFYSGLNLCCDFLRQQRIFVRYSAYILSYYYYYYYTFDVYIM